MALDFGGAMLIVLGAVVTIGVGFLVFRIGWKKVKSSENGGDSGPSGYGTFGTDQSPVRAFRSGGRVF